MRARTAMIDVVFSSLARRFNGSWFAEVIVVIRACGFANIHAAPAAAATAAAAGKSSTEPGRAGVFVVEDIECRQAHVADFLLAERDFLTRREGPRRHIHWRRGGCCGCAARQRQSHSQRRYGPFLPSLRHARRTWHGPNPPRSLQAVAGPPLHPSLQAVPKEGCPVPSCRRHAQTFATFRSFCLKT